MKIDYDIFADAVYVKMTDAKIASTNKAGDRHLVDLDKDGNVVGIEILQASAQDHLVQNLKNGVADGVRVTIQNSTPVVA